MDQQSHISGVRQNYRQRRSEDGANTRNPRLDEDEEYDDVWPSRMPTSARRYHSDVKADTGRRADVQMSSQGEYRTSSNPGRTGGNSIPPRRTATQSMQAIQTPRRAVTQNVPMVQSSRRNVTQNIPVAQPARRRPVEDFEDDVRSHTSGLLKQPNPTSGRRFHWLVYVGLAMIGMLLCWMALTTFLSWWQVEQDDLHYGRPRTSQYDYVVGHNDSNANKSHFIALNLRRHVEVIECPAGDCSKARILIGPVLIGSNQDLAPVTLTFKDVNGDGKPDVVVNVQDSHFVFINDNGTFRPTRPGDTIHL